MSRGRIDVVFAIDGSYAVPAAVVGHSIRAGLRNRSTAVRFHVIDGGLDAAGRRYVASALAEAGDVEVYDVPDRLLLPHRVKHWTSAALGRLHVAAVLPEEVTRAVYLDADTLVLGDLTDLIDVDLGGRAVGAVINEVGADRSWTLADTAVYSDHGAEPPGYFNSGVLLIDMDRWRADGVTEQATRIYQRYGQQLRTHDQDILNIIFSGAWTPIAGEWNKLVEHSVHGRFGNGRLDYLTRREGIVHFIGGVKPWSVEFPPNSLRELYEQYSSALAGAGEVLSTR
jgi:lipopolysaccharide biosynthesis glycosyltransferase